MSKIMFKLINTKCFSCLSTHVLECSMNYVYFLIESVVSKYLNIRLYLIGKRKSEIVDPLRNRYTKLISFKGQ